jgi:hypothetical protein
LWASILLILLILQILCLLTHTAIIPLRKALHALISIVLDRLAA